MSKEEILEAIKKMAEELGRAPSLPELRDRSGISPRQVMYAKYSAKPLLTRFGTWGDVPAGLLFAAEQQGWEGGWEDVLEVARVHLRAAGKAVRRSRTANRTPNQPKIMKDRPMGLR